MLSGLFAYLFSREQMVDLGVEGERRKSPARWTWVDVLTATVMLESYTLGAVFFFSLHRFLSNNMIYMEII